MHFLQDIKSNYITDIIVSKNSTNTEANRRK